MVLASLLFFLPALALSSKDSVAIVPAEDLKVCEYFDARIVRLREIVNKELGPDVDIGSDLPDRPLCSTYLEKYLIDRVSNCIQSSKFC